MSTASDIARTKGIAVSKIFRVSVLVVLVSIAANLAARALAFALLDLPVDFPPLAPAAIVIVTLLGTSMAGLAFSIVVRRARNPIATYRVVALIALVVSILPNFGLMANPTAAPFPGGTAQAFGVLIVFHVIAAAISVGLLTTLTRSAGKTVRD